MVVGLRAPDPRRAPSSRSCSSRCSARRTGSYTRVPTGFVPDEDQGYIFIIIQAPQGASLDYTMNIEKQVEQVAREDAARSSTCSASAASASPARAPNQGILFCMLKDFAERPGRGAFGAGDRRAAVRHVQRDHRRAWSFRSCRRRSAASASSAGSSTSCSTRPAGRSRTWRAPRSSSSAQANQTPGLAGVFTQFTADDPQLVVTIDREQAKSLGISLSDITQHDADSARVGVRERLRLQQPVVSRLRAGRQPVPFATRRTSSATHVRTSDGQMMPLSNVVSVREATAPQTINHYNLFRSVDDQRVGGARLQLGPGAAGDGGAVEPRAAAGHDVRLVGPLARRDRGRQPGDDHLRPRPAARLSDAGGAVRKPHAAVHHPAVGAAGHPGRAGSRSGAAG